MTNDAQISADTMAAAEAFEARAAATRAEFEQQTSELTAKISDLEAAKVTQVTALETSTAEQQKLQSDLEQINERLGAVEAENTAILDQNADLTAQKDELTQTLATLQSDVSNQQSASSDDQATIDVLNDTIAKGLEDQLALKAKAADLENEAATYVARIADLEANVTNTQSDLISQIDLLKGEIAEKTAAIAASEEQLATAVEGVTAQEQALSVLTGNITDYEGQIATLTTEIAALSGTVAERDTTIQQFQESAAASAISPAAICQEKSMAALGEATITFDPGTATLAAASVPLLDELASVVSICAAQGLTLDIEGHTDDSGGQASNLLLSNGRANAIHDALEAAGIPAASMRAVGFGSNEPIADNATSAGQAQNQRIVLHWQQR
jgi:outer membrane protein OmpA-like peptidoglycan-associated protein